MSCSLVRSLEVDLATPNSVFWVEVIKSGYPYWFPLSNIMQTRRIKGQIKQPLAKYGIQNVHSQCVIDPNQLEETNQNMYKL